MLKLFQFALSVSNKYILVFKNPDVPVFEVNRINVELKVSKIVGKFTSTLNLIYILE